MSEREERRVFLGTEFEELENEKDGISKKPLNIQDQVATDEKGRRRFHGAFTGGFSAGYFNTAGTKEGWAPSSFRSTREERRGDVGQTAEDFMDAEDLGDFGIAPRKMRAKREFRDSTKETVAVEGKKEPQVLTGLSDIIKPAESTFGIKLLVKMGWRQGKGIGPKISKQKLSKEAEDEERVYGCPLGPGIPTAGQGGSSSESESDQEIQVLPEDIDPVKLEGKTNLHGLGYQRLDPGNVLGSNQRGQNTVTRNRKRVKGITGQAFGVGVFEEDDEDVYTADDLNQYDFSLGGTGSSTGKHATVASDGGFVEATKSNSGRKFFAPPKIPRDFDPEHKVITFEASEDLTETLSLLKEKLNPILRSRILGEKNYSVRSLLKAKDKSRLDTAQKCLEVKEEPAETPAHGSTEIVSHEELARRNYPVDLEKRQRFLGYLSCLQKGFAVPQPPRMTEWEWEAETREYERLLPPSLKEKLNKVMERRRPLAKAEISAPFAHLLKSKFTNATGGEEEANKEGEDTDKVQAVRMKMFGKLTREQFVWHPGRHLCKAFNVPNPHGSSDLTGVLSLRKGNDRSREVMGDNNFPSTAQELDNRRDIAAQQDSNLKREPVEEEMVENEEETDEISRPPADLFKAIFLDSDESNSDSDNEDETKKSDNEEQNKRLQPFKTRWAPPTADPVSVTPQSQPISDLPTPNVVKTEPDLVIVDDTYGPALPPPLPDGPRLPIGTSNIQRERERSRSRERRSPRKHKSKKKKHKHSKKSKRTKDKE